MSRFEAIVVLAILMLLFFISYTLAYLPAQRGAAQATCTNCIYQIASALFHYKEKYGHYPPPFLADKVGRPIHSWRILLTEFLDPAIFKAYDFNEPWDGPNNRKLSSRMPLCYRCPNDGRRKEDEASYFMLIGAEGISRTGDPALPDEIKDNPTRTLIVAEVAGSGVNWTEPQDLDSRTFGFDPHGPLRVRVSSDDPFGPVFVFTDFTVARIPHKEVSLPLLRSLLTISGGEPIDDRHWKRVGPAR